MMLANDLKILLGSTFGFYIKAHGFHFNVEGPDFHQYHDFFGKIYSDVYDTVDVIGEHIRTLEEYTPGAMSRLMELNKIPDQPQVPIVELMVAELLRDNLIMLEILKHCFKQADNEDKQGIADYLAGRIDAHEKWGWQLRSMVKNTR